MSCAEMRVLLHGMLDHELDLADAVRVETHMQACQDCTAEYRRQGALRAAIRRSEPRYRAPHDLRVRVITAFSCKQTRRAGLRGGGERSPVG
jgi:anti-sigma factor (TIGR02949 family)